MYTTLSSSFLEMFRISSALYNSFPFDTSLFEYLLSEVFLLSITESSLISSLVITDNFSSFVLFEFSLLTFNVSFVSLFSSCLYSIDFSLSIIFLISSVFAKTVSLHINETDETDKAATRVAFIISFFFINPPRLKNINFIHGINCKYRY